MVERSEDIEKVLAAVAAGMSLGKACRDSETVTKSSFLRWLGEDKELADRYARARGEGLQTKAEEICDLCDEPPLFGPDGKIDTGWVQLQRVRIDSRKWLVSKLLPKEYGDRIDLTHGGTVNVELGDAMRKARERLAAKEAAK